MITLKQAALAAALAAAAGGGYWAGGLSAKAALADAKAEHSKAIAAISAKAAAAAEAALKEQTAQAKEIERLQANYLEKENHARREIADLNTAITNGALRLQIATRTTCNTDGLPAADSAAGGANATARADIDPAAAKRIISITADGDEAIRQLGQLQAYVREVCVK